MRGTIEAIFVVAAGGQPMQAVNEVVALEGCGLKGDRYCSRTGYWTGIDECQVTLIQGEHLDKIFRMTGIHVHNGEHRRNIVTRGIQLEQLRGRRFQVGEVILEYDRPRPPCSYVESITEPGMMRALMGRGGICARVVHGGKIRVGDYIAALSGDE